MSFVAIAVGLFVLGKWYDRWRRERQIEQWITDHFGGELSLADRLRIRRLYWGR